MTTLEIRTDRPGATINPAMWGIFFEDINFGADGGLYAELVKNGAFNFPDPLTGWTRISPSLARGQIAVYEEAPFDPANPRYARISSQGIAPLGISNEGYRGMGVRQGEAYRFSAQVRSLAGSVVLRVQLYGGDGALLASMAAPGLTSNWARCAAVLRPNDTDAKARLVLLVEGKGEVDIDRVSLFPEATWKGRPVGLRADMVQLLADLKPGFLRFPGGCIVEGSVLERRYQWKHTIGPVGERKLLINRWNYEFLHRPTPDYFQSFGLGFYEFFQLCEDLGAEPMPILNCGMACQFNSGELCPLDQLDPFIQDALDLVEFANGPAASPWGARRAELGHPEPFNLKMLGIGNEQWGPQYLERYARFADVLKRKHPGIQLISDAGPFPADERFHFLWPRLRELGADIVDEHCYANPVWFLANAHRYDHYDRSGPKVMMGEFAAQSVGIASPKNRNDLECALAEAAYMTGLERNADVVRLVSYAPLFANADAWQWTPDLIWVNSLEACPTPNYYVQQLFMRHRGDRTLPVELAGAELPAAPPAGGIGLGTLQSAVEFRDVRVTAGGRTLLAADFSRGTEGWTSGDGQWSVQDGALRQTDPGASGCSFAGDSSWRDYTFSLQARKIGGAGGFQIRVRCGGPEDYIAWNLGGVENTAHAVVARLAQQDAERARMAGTIETGRWYRIEVRLAGSGVDCYLDGRRLQGVEVPPPQVQRVYASATRDDRTGEVILKVVNPGAATEVEVQLTGGAPAAGKASVIVLASGALRDENSFAEPGKVVPVESELKISAARFTHRFPQHSMTVLRMKTQSAGKE